MRHFQPTVRQLQPLGRRYDSAPIVRERVAAHARGTVTDSPDATASVPPRPRWRRWLTAPASPSS